MSDSNTAEPRKNETVFVNAAGDMHHAGAPMTNKDVSVPSGDKAAASTLDGADDEATSSIVTPDALLSALKPNMDAENKRMSKRQKKGLSLADCCLRSKARIPIRVQEAFRKLSNHLPTFESHDWHSAYATLITQLNEVRQALIRPEMTSSPQQRSPGLLESTSMYSNCWENLTAIFHFLHFVLLWLDQKQQQQQMSSNHHHHPTDHRMDFPKLITQLVQSVVGVLSTGWETFCKLKQADEVKQVYITSEDIETWFREPLLFLQDSSLEKDIHRSPPLAWFCVVYGVGCLWRLQQAHVRNSVFLLHPVWKGLATLLTLKKVDSMNSPLFPGGLIRAVLLSAEELVHEGYDSLRQPLSPASQPQWNFSIKVVTFLLSRLAELLVLTQTENNSPTDNNEAVLRKILSTMCRLEGFVVCLSVSAEAKNHRLISAMSKKIRLCLPVTALGDKVNLTARLLLTTFVDPMSHDDRVSGSKSSALAEQQQFQMGHVSLILYALKQIVVSFSMASACKCPDQGVLILMLQSASKLVGQALPLACYGDFSNADCKNGTCAIAVQKKLLTESLLLVLDVLQLCEVHLNGGNWRFCLMKNWLSVPVSNTKTLPNSRKVQHPLTRELVLTILATHIGGINLQIGFSQWQSFLIQLLCDVRTETEFRRNIACAVVRLWSSCCGNEGKKLHATNLKRQLLEQVEKIKCELSDVRTKKRKRTKGDKTWSTDDLLIVESVRLLIESSNRVAGDDTEGHEALHTKSMNASLLLSALRDDLSTNPVDKFCRLMKTASKEKQSDRLTLLGSGLLDLFIARCISAKPLPEKEWKAACSLLQNVLQTPDKLIPSLWTRSACVLGAVGNVVSGNTDDKVLDQLAHFFQTVLSQSSSWATKAFSLSSLVSFASTVPKKHQAILPRCVPAAMQGRLQCRLQETVQVNADGLASAREQCAVTLSRSACLLELEAFVFITKTLSSIVVPVGSYFMKMPTQEGREAIVIFPPGEESLSDIHHMLALDDDNNDDEKLPYVQTIRNVSIQGGGCRFSLHS